MRAWCFLMLIGCLEIALISRKPLVEADDIESKIQEVIKALSARGTTNPQEEETYLSIEPTKEDARDEDIEDIASGAEDETGEEEDDENDDATVDKPIDEEPFNFLKYPEHEPDYKPYPRFAILKNGFVNHVNLDF